MKKLMIWLLPATAVLAVVGVAVGVVVRAAYRAKQSQNVKLAAQDLKVTPELELAVTRGLDYLARTQRTDGSWPGQHGQVSGVVGLATLAFLGHGEMPNEGKYGDVIKRSVDYIVSTQESNGLLSGKDKASPMYSHGFATLALAEVYGMIDDPRIGPALKQAVGLIVSTQNRLGAWRYSVGSTDADITVTGAQMVALRAAANAGIEVPPETIRQGVAYVRRLFCPGVLTTRALALVCW